MGFPTTETGRVTLSKGEGCRLCRNTGYRGRCGVFEIFPFSSEIKKMTAAGESSTEMRKVAIREGMTTLREDAWRKVREGVTTLEEAIRVTSE
jgi:general secretion pathway protein E